MDIEFIRISGTGNASFLSSGTQIFRKNFVHELDIAILINDISDKRRPDYRDIYLAVECKDTQNFGKSMLKQILGVRRELSFDDLPSKNEVTYREINQNPSTEFWVYSSNSSVNNLRYVGNFGE